MGIIVQGKGLWKALFTRTQRRVLGLLFGYPERSFYANEVVRLAGVGTGAVQRELEKLAEAGILSTRRIGNQKHYQANPECPFYPELRSIVLKTFGSLDLIRKSLRELNGEVHVAFVYGSGAVGPVPPGEKLQVFLVADRLRRQEAESTLGNSAQQLGRELSLVLLSRERFESMLMLGNERLLEVLQQPRVVLAGQYPFK